MTAMTTVRALDLSVIRERGAWDAYVAAHVGGTVFHKAAWGLAIDKALGHRFLALAAFRGQDIAGVLPLHHVRSRLFGNTLISCANAVYGGPLADGEDVHIQLDRHAIALAQQVGATAIEYRAREPQRPDWAQKADLYATFVRPIAGDDDAVLKAVPRKQRAEVRKALDNDLEVSVDRNAARHFAVYAESVRNLGTPVFSPRLFTALLEGFGEDADILTVSSAGVPVASVLSLYDRGQVLPYYGGGTAAARALRANDLMYYRLMTHAVGRGCTLFDFGRSKQGTGAFAFKKNWGFEPQPLTYAFWLPEGAAMPDINPLNPKYEAMIALWRRLPLAIANRLGPIVSRGLA